MEGGNTGGGSLFRRYYNISVRKHEACETVTRLEEITYEKVIKIYNGQNVIAHLRKTN